MDVLQPSQDLVQKVTDVIIAQFLRLEQLVQISLHQTLDNIADESQGKIRCFPQFMMDSGQSSSNKCKNYVVKIDSRHINFLDTV